MEEMEKLIKNAGFSICYQQKVVKDTWKNNWIIIIGQKKISTVTAP
jgi:hypothetical protein